MVSAKGPPRLPDRYDDSEATICPESVDYIEGNVPAYWAEVQFRRASNFKIRFDLAEATAAFRAN
jgi:hypothetical protein